MKTLILIFSILFLFADASGQNKKQPVKVDTTVSKSAMVQQLEEQKKQLQEEFKYRMALIDGQLQLLGYISDDSLSVPKKK
jgi:HJR/Mrr/RecB family endonuclease